jgi:hypothetical protein
MIVMDVRHVHALFEEAGFTILTDTRALAAVHDVGGQVKATDHTAPPTAGPNSQMFGSRRPIPVLPISTVQQFELDALTGDPTC